MSPAAPKEGTGMSDQKTILLVEDNPDTLWANTAVFEAQGCKVVAAGRLREALDLLDETVDAVVLDVLLPDGNALDRITDILAKTAAPVLILTAVKLED